MSTRPLLDRWTHIALWMALLPVLAWSSVAVTLLTYGAGAPAWLCWIPAAALDGAMIAATRVWLQSRLEAAIRRYAGTIAVLGYLGSIVAGGTYHYLHAGHIGPATELADAKLAAVLGGVPSLMAGLLVHVLVMVGMQHRREETAGEELTGEAELLTQAQRTRDETQTVLAQTEQARRDIERETQRADKARQKQTVSRTQPAGTSRPGVPASRPGPVPVTDDLLSRARKVRDERLSQGQPAGRVVLARELDVPERTAKELARRLDERSLRAVEGSA